MKSKDTITRYYVLVDEIDGELLDESKFYFCENPPTTIIVNDQIFSFWEGGWGASFSIEGVMGEVDLKMVGDQIKVVRQTFESFRIGAIK